jgi:bifunctional DNA-binding transcriptional regulator/antitoxin component of YhaV-PrlF toxin-antitoxin module
MGLTTARTWPEAARISLDAGQTTVPKEVREVLDVDAGDKLTWEIRGGRVAVPTERPSLLDFEGFIKNRSGDVVAEIAEARKRRGRV